MPDEAVDGCGTEQVRQHIARFRSEYLDTPAGRAHRQRMDAEPAEVQAVMAEIRGARDAGRPITDLVLKKLLPNTESRFHRDNNYRVSTWPCVTKDVRAWFEGAGWKKPEEWDETARLLFEAVEAFALGQNEAWDAFLQSPLRRGFRAGFISPILHCLDPRWPVINNKVKRTVAFLGVALGKGWKVRSSLEDYREHAATVLEVVRALQPLGLKDADELDIFCHWACTKRLGGIVSRGGDDGEPESEDEVTERPWEDSDGTLGAMLTEAEVPDPAAEKDDVLAAAQRLYDRFFLAAGRRELWGDSEKDGVGLFGGQGRAPDLRHNAFGLLCGLIDEHLRHQLEGHDDKIRAPKILAKETGFRVDRFQSVFSGFEVKRQGETLYSFRQMVGAPQEGTDPLARDSGFLRRFLAFALLPLCASEEPASSAGLARDPYAALAFLALADLVANPRSALGHVHHVLAEAGAIRQSTALIREVGLGLRDIIHRALVDSGASEERATGILEHLPDGAFDILAFALAKSVYDGTAPAKESPLVVECASAETSAAPVLSFLSADAQGAADDPAHSLWTQFNRIAFPKVEYGARLPPSPDSEAAPLADDDLAGDVLNELPYHNLQHNLKLFSTVGLRTERAFDDLRVQYARIDLPDFRYRWRTGVLRALASEFTKTVLEEETSSHLVFLVGPYGTGKTSTAQVLTQALTDQTDWFILAYHPEAREFRFDWLTKEDSAETFRRNELSRLLDPEIFRAIRYELPFDRRILINLSELNAAEPSLMPKQLQLIESLLREIKEKLLPRDIVFFVSLQMYHLAAELRSFFDRKPDLAMGRARLDTAWLIRTDCYQYRPSRRSSSFKEEYLTRLAEHIAGHRSHLTRRAVEGALMDLGKKARSRLLKTTALELEAERRGRPRDRTLATFGLLRELEIADRLFDSWGHSPTFQRAFKLGFGNYTTTTVALANGFVRQTLDILRNEFSFLLREWEVIRELSAQPRTTHAKWIENLARSELVDLLATIQAPHAEFRYVVDEEVWDKLGNRASSLAIRADAYAAAYKEILGNPATVTGRVYTGQESESFDLGFALVRRDSGAGVHFLVDITMKAPERDKGHPRNRRLELTWVPALGRESETRRQPLSLGQFVAALAQWSDVLLPTEGTRLLQRHVDKAPITVVTVDCRLDNRLQVTSYSLTAMLDNEADAPRAREIALQLVEQVVQLRQLAGLEVDLRSVDWKARFGEGEPEALEDLQIRDDAIKSQLLGAWRRAMHLMRKYLPGVGAGYLKSQPSLRDRDELRLVEAQTFDWLGIDQEDDAAMARVRELVPSWIDEFLTSEVDGIAVQRIMGSLPVRVDTGKTSIDGWNRMLRTAWFLYANFCVAGRKPRQGPWQVKPEDAGDIETILDPAAISSWLAKKPDPPSDEIRQRLEALQRGLASA